MILWTDEQLGAWTPPTWAVALVWAVVAFLAWRAL